MISLKRLIKEIATFINLYNEIGSIYITTTETNPSAIFGGKWEKISGRFLLGSGTYNSTTYSATQTGGYADAAVRYHRHGTPSWWSSGSGGSYSAYVKSANRKRVTRYTGYAGSSGNAKNANRPPYKVVHVWRRKG